jgi:subtilase family serine protease
MRAAYYGGGALSGAGQSLGLVEFYGYDAADLAAYFGNSGQVNKVPVNAVSTDRGSVGCLYAKGCDDTEQTLDMTQALGMAPGLTQLNVYVGASDTAILSAMSVPPAGSITGKVDAQLSCSWGWGPADPATDDPLFKKFAAQGQSFFTAAGDSGAYGASTQYVYPADDANVTVVGGTDLATAGPGGPWSGETAWAEGGGGYYAPDNIPIPSWQSAAIAAFNGRSGSKGSTTLRNSPDVAAEANFDFYVCADQAACTSNRYGGTSFAAPMWAGYMALVNQQAALEGQGPVGFLNAALYALGNASGAGYAQALHDVAAGSNGYPAVPGFDLATGWGSPNGAGLINALIRSSSPAFTLSNGGPVSVAAGAAGKTALTSAATGGFDSAIALSASGQPAGVALSFSPALINGAGSSTVKLTVAAGAAAGTYPIVLSGSSGAVTKSATVTLTVGAATLSITGAAPALNVLQGAGGAMTLTVAANGALDAPVALSVSGQPPGVTAALSANSLIPPGSVTLSVAVAANAAAGSYSITVAGVSGSATARSVVTLVVGSPSKPAFAFAVGATALTVTHGTSATFTVQTALTVSLTVN